MEESQLLPATAIVLTSGTAGVGVGGLLAEESEHCDWAFWVWDAVFSVL